MTARFLDDDFLLKSEPARRLYYEYAAAMPILDFHSHLPPREVAENKRFDNIAQIWLGGDHYKWRAMRANGVDERFITGGASDYDKFLAWARTVPKTAGNPLYHWTHLELRRYFGVDDLLDESTAPRIWEACNAALAKPEFAVRGLLKRMRVRAACTTDDPADDLKFHAAYAREPRAADAPALVPTFRPDKVMACTDPAVWNTYLKRLEAAAGVTVSTFADLERALDQRHQAFHDAGARLSDHGLERTPAVEATRAELNGFVTRLLAGKTLSSTEAEAFQTSVLAAVGRMNRERGWTMQLHLGAIRGLNTRKLAELGADTGYDAVGDTPQAKPLAWFLDKLARENQLPRVILYTLNPAWNEVFASIAGSFEDGTEPGRVQLGSAWWFNDQLDGMRRQLVALAHFGLLSRFVGMLTDSRSFLSFPRHEYFRRLLCDIVGGWVNDGELPSDFGWLGGLIQDVCYNNAYRSFGIPGVAER
jgi:glucuronate isomerase